MRRSVWLAVGVTALVLAGGAYLVPAGGGGGGGAAPHERGGHDLPAVVARIPARALAAGRDLTAELRGTLQAAALHISPRVAPALRSVWLAGEDGGIRLWLLRRSLQRSEALRGWPLPAGAGLVAALALLAASRALRRRRPVPVRAVRRMARRGVTRARIARRAHLAQDAVRALAGGRALARRRLG